MGSDVRDIYTISPDGTGLANLTNSPEIDDREPSWSPDQSEIAFASFRDSNYDIYVMPATGGSGINRSNFPGAHDREPAWSPTGTRIAFVSRRTFDNDDTYLMPAAGGPHTKVTDFLGPDVNPAWQALDSPPPPPPPPVNGAYVRPAGSSPSAVPLVVAYNQCTAPNRSHGTPLAFPSCWPPVPSSNNVTTGTPEVNTAQANLQGRVKIKVLFGVPGPPDDSDVLFSGSVTDVRCAGATTACGNANAEAGPDYTGQMQGTMTVRITDRDNSDPGPPAGPYNQGATVVDIPFPIVFSCANTASTAVGGTCTVSVTSANAVVPSAVRDGKRAVWGLGQLEVMDGGPDGNNSTAPNRVFLRAGLFVP
jgi:hypothetical protein